MTRDVEMLLHAARAFGDLRDEVVFVGGAIVDLLVTDPAAPRPRFTDDVDVVVEVTTQVEWYALSDRPRKLGFREDRREGAGGRADQGDGGGLRDLDVRLASGPAATADRKLRAPPAPAQ
jgi:hypothetical protein